MELKEKLKKRLEINKRADEDLGFRLEILRRCEEDAIFWCDNFAYTFDPRKAFTPNIHLPFILWERQREVVRWVEKLLDTRQDGLIEKSRDVGVTYSILIAVVLHRFLFREFNARIGSRSEQFVDKAGDPDTLFWKIAYNLKKLKPWMIPENFSLEKNISYMKITRPDNSNTIIGESANENFGRGGRSNIIVFDEHGFWPYAEASWESAGESTSTRLSMSTPPRTGKHSAFYKLQKSGRVEKFTFHFRDDPRKDEKWTREARSKKSQEEFERELDISYESSLKGTVYGEQFALCDFGSYDYVPRLPLFVAWDFGLDGVAMQWYQWDQDIDRWYLIDSYFNSQKAIDFYIPFVNGEIKSSDHIFSAKDLEKIGEHKTWKSAVHFGDPDVKKRNIVTNTTTRSVLAGANIYVQSKNWEGRTHYDMRQTTLIFLRKLSVDEKRNAFFSECIQSARYPEKSETSQSVSPTTKPIHDYTSHHRTALEYLADNVQDKNPVKQEVLEPIRIDYRPLGGS